MNKRLEMHIQQSFQMLAQWLPDCKSHRAGFWPGGLLHFTVIVRCNLGKTELYTHAYWECQDPGTGIVIGTLKVTRRDTSLMSLSSSSLMRNAPLEVGDGDAPEPWEKHRHYEEGDGKRSFARGQESVQAFRQVSQMNRRNDVMEEKMVPLQRELHDKDVF